MSEITPLSEDALNRFRITHSDRDLRPLFRRLHRLPHLQRFSLPNDSMTEDENHPAGQGSKVDAEREADLIRMELMKWQGGVERVMASVRNLEKQRRTYLKRADETVASTSDQRQILQREQEELVKTRIQRDRHIKCDEIAAKISARARSRKELDEQIAEVQKSLEEHRASHALYLQATSSRIEIFNQITKLVEDCRSTTLPIETQISVPPAEEVSEAMDVDTDNSAQAIATSSTRLSGAALPCQPSSSSTSAPATRASTPQLDGKPKPLSNLNHSLPSRPSRTASNPSATTSTSAPSRTASQPIKIPMSSHLPSRPSALRSTTSTSIGASASAASLEEGEVGEDGEVVEGSSNKRSLVGADGRSSRSVRSRGK